MVAKTVKFEYIFLLSNGMGQRSCFAEVNADLKTTYYSCIGKLCRMTGKASTTINIVACGQNHDKNAKMGCNVLNCVCPCNDAMIVVDNQACSLKCSLQQNKFRCNVCKLGGINGD